MANCNSTEMHSEEGDEWNMEDLEFETTTISSPPFIFQLPEFVRNTNRDAFVPHHITLGLHNWKNKMDPFKFDMAKKAKKVLHLPRFHQLLLQLKPLEVRIRASYNTHFEIDGDRLAKIMLVDALFLLGLFLNIPAQMETCNITPNFDDQNLLMNEALKLENQLPLFVLKSILQSNSPNNVSLPVLLYHFGNSVSPVVSGFFKPNEIVGKIIDPDNMYVISDWYKSRFRVFPGILNQSHHLLHFMYMTILISPLYRSRVVYYQGASFRLAQTFFHKWLSKLECAVDVIESIQQVFGLIQKLFGRKQTADPKLTSSAAIPSASQLHKLQFKFKSCVEGILYTKFIKNPGIEIQLLRTCNGYREVEVQLPPTLHLPKITVDAYTETVFENLLAFEAMANINPPVFARYIELMKALILTPKDLNILKEEEIIKTHDLENDEQVVKLFNRVGNAIFNMKKNNPTTNDDLHRSFQPKNEIFEEINENYEKGLKGMVEEINQCYEGFWIVKAKRYLKKFWSYVVKMVMKMVIFLQIFVVARKLVTGIIGNDVDDEPNYQIPPT